jgi:hypothetical protein
MPVHDWTRVDAGVFHHFHHRWIAEISDRLNDGLLPPNFYALAEQFAGPLGPDVLTLERRRGPNGQSQPADPGPGTATTTTVALRRPAVRFTARTEMAYYRSRQRSVVVRHVSGDRVVALVEVVSPGDKASLTHLQRFVEKAAECLERGYHLLVLDLHPPTPRDPQGIHGAIWAAIEDASYCQPADKPLTLAAYEAGELDKTAYVEPVAVGDVLPEMPLFLEPNAYINVPLEATYQAAFGGVPRHLRAVLEAPSG